MVGVEQFILIGDCCFNDRCYYVDLSSRLQHPSWGGGAEAFSDLCTVTKKNFPWKYQVSGSSGL
jgi:hypothetical protein